MRHLFSIVALASCALAQTASIQGIVTSSLTGSALARVHVVLKNPSDNSGPAYGAETSDDGRFSISGVPATRAYILNAARVGYATFRMSVTLERDENRKNLDLRLTPVGAIRGRITDFAGEPAENLTVIADGVDSKRAITDENGQFRIGGLTRGKYRVKAQRNGRDFMTKPEIMADGSVQLRDASTYFPGVLDARQAQRIEVKPTAESMGVDIQLVGVPFVRVSGKVIDFPRMAGEAYATIASRSMGGEMGHPIKPDGSFEFWGLDPGKYTLSAAWGPRDGSGASTGAIQIEVAGSNVDNIELRVAPESDIVGRLLADTSDLPQPNAQTRVALRKLNSGSNAADPAPVGPDNSFKLTGVRAGKYVVSVSEDGFYVKSTRLGESASDGDILDLINGSGGAGLTLVMNSAVGSITGMVRDENGKSAEALVVLSRDLGEDTILASRSTGAQPDGSYSFANLPPGKYRVAAFPHEDADLVLRPNGLAAFDDLMESVEVASAGKVSRDLKIVR
jgi:Carboxypeptidase regulatory-like domain